jgi:hypothetical protein
MVSDKFSSLCEELGKILKIQLRAHRGKTMLLRFQSGISCYLEQAKGDMLIVIATIGKPPPIGPYRDNFFREALKANGLPAPRKGFFAYSVKQESLLLTDHLSMDDLTGQKLVDFLQPFLQKAEHWKQALERNEIPSFLGTEVSFGRGTPAGGLFGLIR